jgi:hypothetical protein
MRGAFALWIAEWKENRRKKKELYPMICRCMLKAALGDVSQDLKTGDWTSRHQEPGFMIVFQNFCRLGFSTIKVVVSDQVVFDITMTPEKETEIKTWVGGKWEEKTYGPPEMF